MGIQSTQHIKRKDAIQRILEIDALIADKNYLINDNDEE